MSNMSIRGLSNPQGLGQYNAQTASLASQQINWNSIASIPSINLNDLLVKSYDPNHVKKYEIIETQEDALAVSVAHKRLVSPKNYKSSTIPLRNILDSQVFEKVTDEDREIANKIRTYYAHQFVMWTLKGIRLTKFRDCLNTYINGDSKRFKEEYIPIIAKLPYFYEYDIQLDEIKRSIDSDTIDIDKSVQITAHSMTPIKSLVRKNKRIKCIEYWLSDTNNHAYNIQIEINNPLQHLWDNIFKQEMKITGIGVPKRRDDFKYYQLLNWSVAS